MRYCPQCRSEYRPGFDWCPDCKTGLVEALKPDAPTGPEAEADSRSAGESLVVVGTFPTPTAASILASRLEAEGVEAFIDDAETVSMDPLWANAVGGVKVGVRVSDADLAREIAGRPPESPAPDPSEAPVIPCPSCKSPKTMRETFSSRMAFLTILVLGFPWPFRKPGRMKCVACGHAWKGDAPAVTPPEPKL